MKSRTWRHAAAVMAAACAVSIALPAIAMAAGNPNGDVPAVEILPLGTSAHDPDHGTWFVFELHPGEHVHGTAQLINPADVPQQVTLYPRELDFGASGTPSVSSDPTAGIGSWVHFDKTALVVPAQQRIHVGYDVVVPLAVEPGDHTGALVVESQAHQIGGRFIVHKRIATRFYVTLPGKAIVAFRLENLTNKLDNVLWPGSEGVHVSVANTGNVRFVPHVTVNNGPMTGSNLVMTRSVEVYSGTVHVPWYGGPVHIKVAATANGGFPQSVDKTVWVIPWAIIAIALLLLVGLVLSVVYARRRRQRRRRERTEREAIREQLAVLTAQAEAGAVPAQRERSADGSAINSLRRRS
jgi:hypothetical protein